MTAVTALTAQNTMGVQEVLPVPASFIRSQMVSVLSDLGADAIKTGMLHSAETVEAVAETLQETGVGVPLIVDPVMVAKGGASLLNADAVKAMKNELIPRSYVLTPNIPEAEVLTGQEIKTRQDMFDAADRPI